LGLQEQNELDGYQRGFAPYVVVEGGGAGRWFGVQYSTVLFQTIVRLSLFHRVSLLNVPTRPGPPSEPPFFQPNNSAFLLYPRSTRLSTVLDSGAGFVTSHPPSIHNDLLCQTVDHLWRLPATRSLYDEDIPVRPSELPFVVWGGLC
jgi:hypothetical protein